MYELDQTLLGAQRGLLMRAVFGHVLTLYLKEQDQKTYQSITTTARHLSDKITRDSRYTDCGLIVGFGPKLWQRWTGVEIPIQTDILDRLNTHSDVLIYLKTPNSAMAMGLIKTLRADLEPLCAKMDSVAVGKRPDTRIISGRYVDSITNPNDPISLVEDILLDAPVPGATFGFTQKPILNWHLISGQAADSNDEMIGRNSEGAVLSQHAANGHIHRANIRDSNGRHRKLLRQALPFGTSHERAGREEGHIFVAFCNEQPRFEAILKNLLGNMPQRPADRLMDSVEGVGGTYWYIPAAAELNVASVSGPSDVYEDPHWQVSSPNGYLFYNSQDYLHQMAEGRYIGGDHPSNRVLSLMSDIFNQWRNGWVHREIFPRLPHLEDKVSSNEWTSLMMSKSVALRKGHANLITLEDLLSSPQSDIARKNGLLRIQPQELIVGQIPDFTLGRGKEVMPYLTPDERIAAWVKAFLNEWSAMGHVVPDYDKLVTHGLAEMI